ncbi:flippase [Heyndrickxia coagulans]|uniref:flippase n=1 Tax=Heyndrickxia coagulans TaxID=1398 RepID=UPI001C78C557|nr:flippase [Heyndrickxia coagulans]
MLNTNKKLVENILSLIILQGSNYILPLITFPFLVRVLGTQGYGIIAFTTSLMYLFIVFVDFGFNVTITKKIAINQNDSIYISKIFNNVIVIKLILTAFSFIILCMIITFIPKFHTNYQIYLVGFLSVVGSAIFPLWFFQGIEKMRYITLINISTKFLTTALTIMLVREKTDIILAMLLQSMNYLLPGLISLLFVTKKYKFNLFNSLDIKFIKKEFVEGIQVFLSSIWVNIYVQGPMLITGFIAGDKAAGYYGIGQKIMAAMVGVMQPISQATYPHMCHLYEKSVALFREFKKKLLLFCITSSFLVSALMFTFSQLLIKLVTGHENYSLDLLIKLFSIAVLIIIINTQLTQIIYVLNKYNALQKMNLFNAIFFTIISIPLTFKFQSVGMIMSVIIIELISTIISINIIGIIGKNKVTNEVIEKAGQG